MLQLILTRQWQITKGISFLSHLAFDRIRHKAAKIPIKNAAMLQVVIQVSAKCFSWGSNIMSASQSGVHRLLLLSLTYKWDLRKNWQDGWRCDRILLDGAGRLLEDCSPGPSMHIVSWLLSFGKRLQSRLVGHEKPKLWSTGWHRALTVSQSFLQGPIALFTFGALKIKF